MDRKEQENLFWMGVNMGLMQARGEIKFGEDDTGDTQFEWAADKARELEQAPYGTEYWDAHDGYLGVIDELCTVMLADKWGTGEYSERD